MKKKTALFIALAVILCLFVIFKDKPLVQKELFAMDTLININIKGRLANKASIETENEIKRLNYELGVNEEGALSSYNKGGEKSEELSSIIEKSIEISRETDGAFDISIYPVLKLWGFTQDSYSVPSYESLMSVGENTGWEKINENNLPIDLGACAKGYGADRIKEILSKNRVSSALISLGGTVLCYGQSEAKIAVKNPFGDGVCAIIKCKDEVVSTSGDYERFFEEGQVRYGHIIDPSTFYPATTNIKSATVLSESGFYSDALSTALFVMGENKAKEFYKNTSLEFGFLLITDDKRIIATENIDIYQYDDSYELEIVK